MTSKRDLERRLAHLEDATPTAITLTETYDWLCALNDRRGDVGRPRDYFGSELEWSANMQEVHARAVARHPELAHVTPAEAYALVYMNEKTKRAVLDLLSHDSSAEAFWDAAPPH